MMPPYHPDNPGDQDNAAYEQPAAAREDSQPVVAYRGSSSDPVFGMLVAVALSLGLTTLPPGNTDLRYTLAWLVLATVGVLGWLLGNAQRIGQELPENLAWGVGFGLLIGAPLLAFGGSFLGDMTRLIFPDMSPGTILAFLIFVMPVSETLFFRSILQQSRPWWMAGVLSSLWAMLLFFPTMWADVIAGPAVAIVIAIILAMINLIYSYVCYRNSLAAAWVCQIVINLVVLFIPSL